jgi:hypothetical protein
VNGVGAFLVAVGFGMFVCGLVIGLVVRWVLRRPYVLDLELHLWLLRLRMLGLVTVLIGAVLEIAARL